MCPRRISRYAFQPVQQDADHFYFGCGLDIVRSQRYPRRGSNAQPPDSKSVTLSIELRGQYVYCGKYVQSLHCFRTFLCVSSTEASWKHISCNQFYQSLSKMPVGEAAKVSLIMESYTSRVSRMDTNAAGYLRSPSCLYLSISTVKPLFWILVVSVPFFSIH
jgi:hypothetical protein